MCDRGEQQYVTILSTTVIPNHESQAPGDGIRPVTAKSIAARGDDEKVQYLLTVFDDMTERRRAEQRITHMAHYDSPIEPFNECFSAAIDRSAKSGERFAILGIDVDHFKEANDPYGHAVRYALLC